MHIEKLMDELIEMLLKRNDPFEDKIVVCPSNKTIEYIKSYFLKNSSKALMNVRFMLMNDLLFELLDNGKYTIPNKPQRVSLMLNAISSNNIDLNGYLTKDLDYGNKLYDASRMLVELFDEYENRCTISNYKELYDKYINCLKSNGFTTLYQMRNNAIKHIGDIYTVGFYEYTKLEEAILDKCSIYKFDINALDIKNDMVVPVIKAPNRLREIERLHTEIVNILDSDRDARLSDFLVLSPDISSYSNEIKRVFDQENERFPRISYSLNCTSDRENFVLSFLKNLYGICSKGFFHRLDFYNIIVNRAIMKSRGITEGDIKIWMESIVRLHVYRNDTNNRDDWKYIRNRLLLSKLSDINEYKSIIVGDEYLPYTTIELSDDSIIRFIDLIDDLNDMISLCMNHPLTDKELLESLKDRLSKWLSIKEYGVETNGYLAKLLELIDLWILNKIYNIPLITLFSMLFDAIDSKNIINNSLYSGGVTFTGLSFESVISARYVFLIGASSSNLPVQRGGNPFDDKLAIVNNDFEVFKRILSSPEHLYISYIYMNEKSGEEELFLSSYVDDFVNPNYIEIVPIDERREWKDITTNRGFRNKELVNNINDFTQKHIDGEGLKVETIKASEIVSFLEDPIVYKTERLFGKRYDKTDDINSHFEPLELSALDESYAFKKLIKFYINIKDFDYVGIKRKLNALSGSAYEFTKEEMLELQKRIDEYDSIINKELALEKILPDYNSDIFNKALKKLKKKVDNFINLMGWINYERFELLKINDFTINIYGNDVKFELNIDVIKCVKDTELFYLPIFIDEEAKKKLREKYIILPYVASLYDAYSHNYEGFTIMIFNAFFNEPYQYTFNKNEALEYLEKIYIEMNNFDDMMLFNYSILNEKKDIGDKFKLISIFNGPYHNKWTYFSYSSLYDLYSQSGYTDLYFDDELQKKIEKHKSLFKYISGGGSDGL